MSRSQPPQEEEEGWARAVWSSGLVLCAKSCASLEEMGLSLDRALWVCRVEGQIGASGSTGDIFHRAHPSRAHFSEHSPCLRQRLQVTAGVVISASRELSVLCQLAASHHPGDPNLICQLLLLRRPNSVKEGSEAVEARRPSSALTTISLRVGEASCLLSVFPLMLSP